MKKIIESHLIQRVGIDFGDLTEAALLLINIREAVNTPQEREKPLMDPIGSAHRKGFRGAQTTLRQAVNILNDLLKVSIPNQEHLSMQDLVSITFEFNAENMREDMLTIIRNRGWYHIREGVPAKLSVEATAHYRTTMERINKLIETLDILLRHRDLLNSFPEFQREVRLYNPFEVPDVPYTNGDTVSRMKQDTERVKILNTLLQRLQ